MTAPSLLIVVPARGGSKRLPGKNIKLLAGKSLLAYTADAITASGLKVPVILTTDDDAIAAEGERLGWIVPFRRPPELASDNATTTEAVLHTLDWYKNTHGHDMDAVMVLQPTSPFRGGACLVAAVELLRTRPEVDSVIAMTALHLPPARLYFADEDGLGSQLAIDARRPVYVPNGALYLTRSTALRQQNTLYAGRILPLPVDKRRAIDIDTEKDWHLAEALLKAGLPPETSDFTPESAV